MSNCLLLAIFNKKVINKLKIKQQYRQISISKAMITKLNPILLKKIKIKW